MNENIRGFLKDEDIYQIYYGDASQPRAVLGRHIVGEGQLILAHQPDASEVWVVDRRSGARYFMELIWDKNLFGLYLPVKEEFPYYYEVLKGDEMQQAEDPYRFPFCLPEEELAAYTQGSSCQLYQKLGANSIVVDGTAGVLFAVWAPNANRVSVVGDFNGYQSRMHLMDKREPWGIFELFLPGVKIGDAYQYEIKTPTGEVFRKTDPCGRQQLLRPRTQSVVADLHQYQWNDKEYVFERGMKHGQEQPMAVYELHLGSWKRNEENGYLNYRQIADELAVYILEMGYTHVELIGLAEYPFDGSWGYQVSGYYALTSRFGTPEDFMYFVDTMHANGIGVIMDWVPGHFPKDPAGLAFFDGSCCYEYADPSKREHAEWGTHIFDFGKKAVMHFLLGSALFWVEEYHLDGLRVDAVASMLYLDYGKHYGEYQPNEFGGTENLEAVEFMRHLNRCMEVSHPDILIFAEESTAWVGVTTPVENGGLGFEYKWNMGWMHDFLEYMSADPGYRKYLHEKMTGSVVRNYAEAFLLVLSHDEVVHGKGSMIRKMPGNYFERFANLRLTYGYMFAHPGKKLLFMGQDFAQWEEWNENQALHWDLLDQEIHAKQQNYMRDLLHFYRKNPALFELDHDFKGFEWINIRDEEHSVASFARKTRDGRDCLLIVCNFSNSTYNEYRLGVPSSGAYEEVFSSNRVEYGGIGGTDNGIRYAEAVDWDYRKYSITAKLPPLSIQMFRYQAEVSLVVRERE